MSAGDLEEAQRALDSCMAQFGERNKDTLDAMSRLAKVHLSLGDLASARPIQEKVFSTRRELLGPDDSSTIWAANDYANTLQKLGELGLARTIQQGNLAAVERNYERDDEETMVLQENLAAILWQSDDLTGSVELQQKNLDGLRRLYGNHDPRTIKALNYLANTKHRQGDYVGAIPLQLRAITEQIRFRFGFPRADKPRAPIVGRGVPERRERVTLRDERERWDSERSSPGGAYATMVRDVDVA
jgi:tetratricopeptide (TPR) repeat protein